MTVWAGSFTDHMTLWAGSFTSHMTSGHLCLNLCSDTWFPAGRINHRRLEGGRGRKGAGLTQHLVDEVWVALLLFLKLVLRQEEEGNRWTPFSPQALPATCS